MPIENLPNTNIPARTLQDVRNEELNFIVDDMRVSNYDKALSIVTPLSEISGNLQRTGALPKQDTIASLTMKEANKLKLNDYSDVKVSDVYRDYSDGSRIARYDTYSTVNLDQEEYAASKQTSGDLWSRGLANFGLKTINNAAGTIGGFAYGVIDAARTGSMQSLFDNKFMDYINDFDTYVGNTNAIYKSKEDREATGLDYWTRGTTFADDVSSGLSFLTGALAGEAVLAAATGGQSLSSTMARVGLRLGQSQKVLKAFNAARKLSNPASKVFATGRLETSLGINFGKAGDLINTGRFVATSSGFESSFESNAFKKEMEEGYYTDFERLNGRMPTIEEEKEFRRNLDIAAEGVYKANFLITAPSNLLVVGKIFGVKNPLSVPNKWADSKLFGIGYKKVGEEFVETSANKLQKAIGKSYSFTKPMFVEGIWEEGMQSVVQNTGRNWVEAKYDPQYTKNGLSLMDSFSEGLSETYGTAEGWKEIQMGMLIGLLGGTAGNRIATGKWNPDYSKAKAENKLIVDTRNTYSGTRIAEVMAYGNRVQQAQANSEKAEAAGDFTGQEMARKDAALAQLNFAHNLGYMEDAVSDTVIAIKNMDNETLMKEYGVDEKGAESLKESMIAEYKNTADTYKKNSDFAEYFINSRLSKEEKAELKGHDVTALREALAYELTMGAEMDTFSSDILQAIKNKVGTTILGQDISDTLEIEHVLSKAGKDTKRQVEKKVSQITKLKSEMMSLDEQYKKLETTFYNSTSEEQKKSLLSKMDAITTKKAQLEQERTNLAKETDILFNTAKLKNPFNKEGSSVIITAAKLEVLEEQSKAIKDLVSSYEKVSPQDALELQKLVEEYTKSLSSFQRYADLARQITDPKLGLRGKRNFISEIKREKSPNEVTIEMIETLLPRMVQAKNQVVDATLEGNEKVQEVTDKGEDGKAPEEIREIQKDGDTIPMPTAEEKQAAKEAEKQKVRDEYDAKIAGLQTPVEETTDTEDSPKQIAKLREQEQKDLLAAIPDAKNALTDGKVDKNKLTNPEDIAKFEEIYDRYDKLITPLLKGQQTTVPNSDIEARKKLSGWEASYELARIAKQEGVDLSILSREEYADYAIKNYLKIDDSQLRANPKHRNATSVQEVLDMLKADRSSLTQSAKDAFDSFYRAMMTLAEKTQAERFISEGVRILSGTKDSNSWLFFSINNGTNDSESTTNKSYFSLKNLNDFSPEVFKNFMAELQKRGYNGGVKIFQDLEVQGAALSDQVVMHGYSETDAKLALEVAKEFFGDKLLESSYGKDEVINGVSKSYSQILSDRIKDSVDSAQPQAVEQTNKNDKEIKKLEKEKQAKLDVIDKKYQDKTEEPAQEKKDLIDSVVEMVRNSPYLLENFGENILDLVPTEAEIEEFYELAARAIDDPRIDTELIAFKNPYNSKRFSPTTRPSLTKAEVTRLQELNQKMANWQLIEGYQNENGVSLQQMIMQAVAVRQTVEPIIREKLTDSDLINLSDNEPLEVDGGNGIRKEQYIQVYEDVLVKRKGNSVKISHLTLPGLLERMGTTGEIGYVQTKYENGKNVEVKGSAKVITPEEVEENSLPGANFIVTLADGSKVNLTVERSGAISVKSEDFPKVMAEANMKHVEGTLNRNGGYSPVYDLETGEKLKTDYRNASDYSPREIYNMEPGESAEVTFSLDMNDEYNIKLIQNYEKGLDEGRSIEELEKELFENIKINVLDADGRKLGDLKAAYDVAGIPGYLDLRREAFETFKTRMESGIMGTASLSKASYIKHIFLGSPNFTFENNSIKMFDIIPEQVIDYGYIENGKLVLKNNTKGVREDFIKGLLGRTNQPVVVVKQGKYMVAFPVALKESEANLTEQVTDIFTDSKNKAEAALKLNQLLADNGFSPASYNLFYIDESNQNIVDSEGFPTKDLLKAIDDLASITNVSSVKDWMLPEHTTTDLANEASIGLDMANNMFSSPKPIIELDDLKELIRDWYSEALKDGDVSEEKAIEIATKIFYRKRISIQEGQFVQSDRVTEALNRMYELNDEAQDDADSQKNKPCE